MATSVLTGNFLNELFKKCLKNIKIFETTRQFIKYTYFPSEHYKEVWKVMCDYVDASSSLITYGLLTETFNQYPDKDKIHLMRVLGDIKKADIAEDDSILDQLEVFIKNKLFIETYDQLSDLFNKGQKQGAFELMGDIADQLKELNVRSKGYFSKVFEGFLNRHDQRKIDRDREKLNPKKRGKIPTGIKPLDAITRGGISRGDTLLALAPSGVGKSKFLKWIGLSAAMRGFNVLHIQLEGSEKEAKNAYDAGFLGINFHEVDNYDLDKSGRDKIEKAINQITFFGGEIFVKAYEQFDSASYRDFRDYMQQLSDDGVEIDLLIVDYLELAEPGNGKKYSTNNEGERARRLACAEALKNICIEFNCGGATATQANSISPQVLNDPEQVLTRYNISEAKGIIKPFPIFLTLNQTQDEKKERVMRLFLDKARHFDQSKSPIIHINTDFEHERFYDHINSVKNFGYEQ